MDAELDVVNSAVTLAKIEANEHIISKLKALIDNYEATNARLRAQLGNCEEEEFLKDATFAVKLKWYLMEYDVTQATLARYLGSTQKTVSRYVRGESTPSKEVQKIILGYFNRFK